MTAGSARSTVVPVPVWWVCADALNLSPVSLGYREDVARTVARACSSVGPVALVSFERIVVRTSAPAAVAGSDAHPIVDIALSRVTLLARWWDEEVAVFRKPRREGDGPEIEPLILEGAELTGFTDAENLLILRHINELANSGEYAAVVVDAPGISESAAILTTPATFAAYAERVWPRHRRLVQPLTSKGPTGAMPPAAATIVERLGHTADQLTAVVNDRSALRLVYVAAADTSLADATRAQLGALEVLGLRPQFLIVADVPQADPSFSLDLPHPVLQAFKARRDDALAAVATLEQRAQILDRAVVVITADGDLGPLAEQVARPVTGLALPRIRVNQRDGTGLESVYELGIALPLVDPGTIALGRIEEDVVLEAHGVRRRIRLPSVLRRCVVGDATFAAGELVVAFTPDPRVWPQ